MASVTGQVGDKTVILDNAATEATLKLLLQATTASTREQRETIAQMAERAGLNPETVRETNAEISAFGLRMRGIGGALGGLSAASEIIYKRFNALSSYIEPLTDGLGKASAAVAPFQNLGGIIGTLASVSVRLLQFQEAQLEQYRSLTDAGVNFGGSLTQLRLAAANSYLTVDQFTSVIMNNREAFQIMGKTSNEGAIQFSKLSNALISGNAGTNLMALGYTTAEINDQMAKYIQATGARTQADITSEAGMKKLTESTNTYLLELDALTQFTGVSKKKIEEEQKKAQLNEAFQRKMAGLGEEERLKLKLAYDKAAASGIEGATDLVMSTALGFGPMTEASQKLTGVAGEAAQGITEMTQIAMQTGTNTGDVNRKFADFMVRAANAAKNYGTTADALSMKQGVLSTVMNSLLGVENKLRAKGINDTEEFNKQQEEIAKEQLKRQESEAKEAAETEKAVKELGISIMNSLMPVFKVLLSVLNPVIQAIGAFAKYILDTKPLLIALGIAVAALTGIFLLNAAKIGAAAATKGFEQVRGVAGSVLGGGPVGTGPIVSPSGGPVPTNIPSAPPAPAGAGGSGNILRSLARGLRSLANPRVMLGVVTLGLIAGAMAVTGLSLKQFADVSWESIGKGFATLLGLAALAAAFSLASPVLLSGSLVIAALGASLIPFGLAAMAAGKGIESISEGLKKLTEINSSMLSGLATSMSSISGAMLKLTPLSLTGPLIAFSFKQIADSLTQLSKVDVAQLDKVVGSMKSIKESSPGITDIAARGFAGFVSKFVPTATSGEEVKSTLAAKTETTTETETTKIKKAETDFNLVSEIKRLNTISLDMLKTLKESTDLIKKNVDATKGLNRGLWT